MNKMMNELNTTTEDEIHVIGDDATDDYAATTTSPVGFKCPQPWDNMTEEERRAEYKGFLYPSWFPFAACEGNYAKSEYFNATGYPAPKVQGGVDEALEQRKKQFAVPMVNKSSYKANASAGMLKRS